MTTAEKKIMSFSVVLALMFCVPQTVSAMHIMEGYLSPAFSIG